MEDLIKKVSYLKGYADGLDLSPKSDEGKLIIKLLDVMSEMADTIEELNSRVDDVEDVVDGLDVCVLEIADDLYGEDMTIMMTMTTMIISTIMMTMITTVTEMIILKFNVLTAVKTL